MARLHRQNYYDIERIIEFDFVRATEAAALNSLRWLGRGDKEAADAAACDAIRGMFDLMNICGEVVIGEGIKDEAPGIFKGEQLGTWIPGSPQFDIAIDPIDGTTNISKGAPNSISCIGGEMQSKMWARDEKERQKLVDDGYEKNLSRVFSADDLANGKNIVFCATGISDSALLRGVKGQGAAATTHSILMRAKSRTVRFIRATHDLQTKTIRLRSDNREHLI